MNLDFQCLNPILDPVIVISKDGIVNFINSAGRIWLGLHRDSTYTDRAIGDFIDLTDFKIFDDAGMLPTYGFSEHVSGSFGFALKEGSGMAKITVQKYPEEGDLCLYAIHFRDPVFAEQIFVNPSLNAQLFDVNEDNEMIKGLKEAVKEDTLTNTKALDEDTMSVSMASLDRQAALECLVSLFVVDIKTPLKGTVSVMSDDWFEALARTDNVSEGMKCNIEIVGTPELRGFSCQGEIVKITEQNYDKRLRIKFESLSALTKQNVSAFLDKFSIDA